MTDLLREVLAAGGPVWVLVGALVAGYWVLGRAWMRYALRDLAVKRSIRDALATMAAHVGDLRDADRRNRADHTHIRGQLEALERRERS